MKKLKHNHTLTDFLKFGIFAILLLMPILIFVPNAFYYGFNEHATNDTSSVEETLYYETNDVNNENDLINGRYYNLNIPANNNLGYYIIYFKEYTILSGTYNTSNEIYTLGQVPYLKRGNNNTYQYLAYQIANASLDKVQEYNGISIDILYNKNINEDINILIPYLSRCTNTYIQGIKQIIIPNITNKMSYAWDSVWENELFSWTSNTGIYTVINNMNTTLGIPAVARLADYLTYITLFTVIYVIIDIIIGTFTMLTHLFNKEPK